MKTFITYLIGLMFLALCASCTSKSGKLAEQRKIEIERGYDAIIVQYNTGVYKVLNDSVAMRPADNVYFKKHLSKKGEYRWYRVQ